VNRIKLLFLLLSAWSIGFECARIAYSTKQLDAHSVFVLAINGIVFIWNLPRLK